MMNTVDTRAIIGQAIQPLFEGLEGRQMLSGVWFADNTVNIVGTDRDDTVAVFLSNDGQTMWARLNGVTSSAIPTADVFKIDIRAGNGNNRVSIEERVTTHSYVITGEGNDTIRTGNGNDYVNAGAGSDRVYSRGGRDIIETSTGRDIIDGGTGDNIIMSGPGSDIVYSSAGKDEIYSHTGNDTLFVTAEDYLGDANRLDQVIDVNNQNNNQPIPPRVTKLSLVNADTGQVVAGYENLQNGSTLDLATLPARINIAASVEGQTESLKFDLAGGSRIDNDASYTLDASAWSPLDGAHTLRVTPYAGNNATGTAGVTTTLNLTVRRVDQNNQNNNQNNNNNNPAAPQPVIEVLTANAVVGQALHVQGTGTTLANEQIEDGVFRWDFGDPTGRFNTLPGFNASHVYDRPGTYTIKLTVTNAAGVSGVRMVNVSVVDASTRVVYLASNGSDSNTGGNATRPVKSLARAIELAGANDIQILLRRGDRFDVSATTYVSGKNVTISSYGVGDKPVINWVGDRNRNVIIEVKQSAENVTVRGITFDSKYSTDTHQTGMPIAVQAGGKNLTVRDNTFLNLGFAVNANWSPNGLTVMDNTAPLQTGLRDYFTWVQGNNVVIVGNIVANSTREHVVRVGGAERILIAHNDFTNLDRRNSGDQYDSAKGAITNQKGTHSYIAYNRIDGPAGIGPLGKNDGLTDKAARFVHAVAEGNTYTRDTLFIQHGAEHISVRHNTFKFDSGIQIAVEGFDSAYGRGVKDLRITDNTGINNSTSGNFLNVGGSVDGILLTGNLYVAPNLTPGSYTTAAVFVNQADLRSFTRISGNVWPSAARANGWAQGGVMFVGTDYTGANHLTPARWNALPQVGEDFFTDVSLTSGRTWTTLSGRDFGARLAA
jgi:PKD repeat protein